jgi:signal transduction histidine kinase
MWRQLSLFNHSFRLMLYLEWILLSITVLGQIRPHPPSYNSAMPWLSLMGIAVFGLMGLRLPTGKAIEKLIYTAVEFGLLFFPALLLSKVPPFLPLLGIVLVIRSCLIFEETARWIVAGLVAVSCSIILFQKELPLPPPDYLSAINSDPDFPTMIFYFKLSMILTFGLALLFIILLVNALLTERQSGEKLTKANDRLREYAIRLEDRATLQERNRITREIHDSLGHALTAQSIQLENALLFLGSDTAKSASFLKQAQELGGNALKDVRRSISTLHDPLQGKSLQTTITQTTNEWAKTSGIAIENTINLFSSPPREVSTALYRIIQESLTNISKHSGASIVKIYLQEIRDSLRLEIEDNGRGFDLAGNTTGFGLRGMEERATALGGRFAIATQLGKGCRIFVSVPAAKERI